MNYAEESTKARLAVLNMIYAAQTSHIGSNFSCIDILNILYDKANIDLKDWENRDRIILSKGWAAASLYYFLARKGIIPESDLLTYCKPGSPFIGLADMGVKGVETIGGSMGHGLPVGVGMALAFIKEPRTLEHPRVKMVYVLMSDGEMDCGTTWESAAIANHHKLNNLLVFVDVNNWQAMGRTSDVLDMTSLHDKWNSFGWNVFEINGHDFDDIEHVIDTGRLFSPTVILCHTVKGKGCEILSDKLEWHYRNIDKETYDQCVKELSESQMSPL